MTDDKVFLCAVHTEPGHRVVQAIFWTLWPSQKAPPLSGAGLVQVLVRFWKPLPQRLLHTDHSVQVDQPPFTAKQEKKAWSHKQPSLGSPRALLALCRAASNSGHRTWHKKQHWPGTNPRLQHTKCTAEVIVQAKEMLMLNEKHHLMTIRVGRWPALSWKPTWPSLRCLVECVWPKSLQVQRALAARSSCSEKGTVFQREITCATTHAQMHPSPMHAQRPPCFD